MKRSIIVLTFALVGCTTPAQDEAFRSSFGHYIGDALGLNSPSSSTDIVCSQSFDGTTSCDVFLPDGEIAHGSAWTGQ